MLWSDIAIQYFPSGMAKEHLDYTGFSSCEYFLFLVKPKWDALFLYNTQTLQEAKTDRQRPHAHLKEYSQYITSALLAVPRERGGCACGALCSFLWEFRGQPSTFAWPPLCFLWLAGWM